MGWWPLVSLEMSRRSCLNLLGEERSRGPPNNFMDRLDQAPYDQLASHLPPEVNEIIPASFEKSIGL